MFQLQYLNRTQGDFNYFCNFNVIFVEEYKGKLSQAPFAVIIIISSLTIYYS